MVSDGEILVKKSKHGKSAIFRDFQLLRDVFPPTCDYTRQANTDAHHQVDLGFGDGGEDKGMLLSQRIEPVPYDLA